MHYGGITAFKKFSHCDPLNYIETKFDIFLIMGQSFRYFLDTISIIPIEKSVDGVLGI